MVKPGQRFGAFNQYAPGDIVEMSETEAAGFADKLAPAPAAPAAQPAPVEQPAPPELIAALDGLPEGALEALLAGGFVTVNQVRHAPDAALLALPGIGRATLRKIREALK
jgi:hypothetical protein